MLSNVPQPAAIVQTLGKPLIAAGPSPVTPPAGATNFDAITGATAARNAYGVDGTGTSVAVIDTGVNYNNVDFGGGGFGPGHKVIAGFDFSSNSPDPYAQTWQHGTAVAGLIAGNSPIDPGIAPGANIVALRVFGNDNASSYDRIVKALQWVIDNRDKYNITVVNISLSDGGNYTQNYYTSGVGGQIVSLVHQLTQMNIPVVTATGNSFSGAQGEGFSAIVPESLSVTATTANDQLVANAQRLGRGLGGDNATVIAAPGQGMYVPADGNNFTTMDGTSVAAPIVSGAVVLLQQIYKQRFGSLPTVKQIEGWLQGGAVNVHDSVTGIDLGRLSITGAAALIPSVTPTPAPTPTPTPIPAPTPTPATNYVFNGQAIATFNVPSKASSGWATFFSLFSGRLKTVSGWGKTTAPIPQGNLHPTSTVVTHQVARAKPTHVAVAKPGFVGHRKGR
jgi:type VI secretion system secreted protein VgrG